MPPDMLPNDVAGNTIDDVTRNTASGVSGPAGHSPGNTAGDVTGNAALLAALETAHAGEVAALRGRAEVAERRADAAEMALADQRVRADRMAQEAISAARELDNARQRGDEAQRELDKAEDAIVALREQAERLQADVARAEQQIEATTADDQRRCRQRRERVNSEEPEQIARAELREQMENLHHNVTCGRSRGAGICASLDAARQQAREAEAGAEPLNPPRSRRRPTRPTTDRPRSGTAAGHGGAGASRGVWPRPRRAEGQGTLGPAPGGVEGGIAMPAADDLRRVLRRAGRRPGAVLRGFWVRLRAAWRGE